jgi:hypothetical protein
MLLKLDDKFFADELDDDEDDQVLDRRRRFQQAYRIAMESDSQGYVSVSSRGDVVSDPTAKGTHSRQLGRIYDGNNARSRCHLPNTGDE